MTTRFNDDPHEESDYIGPATIIIRGTEIETDVELRGYREPIDGIFRWIGRTSKNKKLAELVGDLQRQKAVIRTSHSAREAYVGDPDFWGRYRIVGKSTPPYHVETDLAKVEAEAEAHAQERTPPA
ncbi:hypothetical protein GOHSU_30_00290 [Gordonia hirsuta DSM 44140 = NBRC 16056]|uniref:DUF4873 domain-containing protein n=1 Tax=Gordonia hirsuta DSM 44140 = NBRC 16056 TaxID=1121927 RepID=L7LAE2_9ACTN|nr:DUF4873 domain-containing protein [Gordonia hirsuta]GAC58105.1 hypothetical protein GOHSU_30_00290 [Gordonia hirsuta DSM 44140 = NBRC 16056]